MTRTRVARTAPISVERDEDLTLSDRLAPYRATSVPKAAPSRRIQALRWAILAAKARRS